ncbi:MAG: hypothetical protein K6T78_13895 [Alicyclobacillus sp.]|nr:hypothetical protein [Alicyclobacillus sp.]
MNPWIRNLLALAVITGVEVGLLGHYNHLLSAAATDTVPTTAVPVTDPAAAAPKTLANIQPLSPNLMAVSDDGQKFVYVDKNLMLRVLDISTGQTEYTLQLKFQPVYLSWIRDDTLFIGTEAPDGNLIDLRLSTITLLNGNVRLIHVFSGFSPDATFENVTFSPYTNDTYILIASSTASVMYHYDTNGNLNQVDLGGRDVKKAAATTVNDDVFFQDFVNQQPNVLMRDNNGNITLLQTDAVLLRLVGTTAYYGKLDSNGDVTEIDSYTAPGGIDGNASGTTGSAGADNASNAAGGGSAGGSGTPGQSRTLLKLSTPIPPANLYIANNADVYDASTSGVQNLSTNDTVNVPAGTQPVIRSNGMMLLAPDGTVTFIL